MPKVTEQMAGAVTFPSGLGPELVLLSTRMEANSFFLSQGLCTCCSFCLKHFPLDCHIDASFSSFRSQLKCHYTREAFLDHPLYSNCPTAPQPYVHHMTAWNHVIYMFSSMLIFYLFPSQPRMKPSKEKNLVSFVQLYCQHLKQRLAHGRKHIGSHEMTDIAMSSQISEALCWGGWGFKALIWRYEPTRFCEFTLHSTWALYGLYCRTEHVSDGRGQCHHRSENRD